MEKLDRFAKLHEMGYDIEQKEQPVIILLEDAMLKKKITSMRLCKKTGISRQTMNAVLNGKMKPGVDFALKVSKVLDIPVEDLFHLHESAWETLVIKDSQSIYWDIASMEIIERKDMKKIVEREGEQYWDMEEDVLLSEAEYEAILAKELDERLEEEIENARKLPVGRRDEKVFQRMAKDVIIKDIETRYPLRFQRVVTTLKAIE